jgi:rhodanese-related sulfurtransferase
VPRITARELKARLDRGEDVTVVDSRRRKWYDKRRIPGAVSMPTSEVAERHGELPQTGQVVYY